MGNILSYQEHLQWILPFQNASHINIKLSCKIIQLLIIWIVYCFRNEYFTHSKVHYQSKHRQTMHNMYLLKTIFKIYGWEEQKFRKQIFLKNLLQISVPSVWMDLSLSLFLSDSLFKTLRRKWIEKEADNSPYLTLVWWNY